MNIIACAQMTKCFRTTAILRPRAHFAVDSNSVMARAVAYHPRASYASSPDAPIDMLAFDLDHALLRYRVPELMSLIYTCLRDALVEGRAVPESAFAAGWAGERAVAKGLILDLHTGDLLKLDGKGVVAAAAHGTARIDAAAISRVYGHGAAWPGMAALATHARSPAFFVWLTYFDMPAMRLAQQLVDWRDAQSGGAVEMPAPPPAAYWAPLPAAAGTDAAATPVQPRYASVATDLLWAFERVFDNETAWDGPFFAALRSSPLTYVWPRHRLRASLLRLRSAAGGGRRVALVTNSHIRYAEAMLDAALGSDWRDAFDILVYNALKPAFFSPACPAFRACDWERGTDGAPLAVLRVEAARKPGAPPAAATQGNAAALQALADALLALPPGADGFAEAAFVPGTGALSRAVTVRAADGSEPTAPSRRARVIFVGDHLHGDVAASSRAHDEAAAAAACDGGDNGGGGGGGAPPFAGWLAVAIVEELEQALPVHALSAGAGDGASDSASDSASASARVHDLPWHESHGLGLATAAIAIGSAPDDGDDGGNAWGSLFTAGGRQSLYCAELQRHAALAVSDVEALLDSPLLAL